MMTSEFDEFSRNHTSLSVLTWRAPKTLAHTLDSIAPIRDLFRNRFVICQDSDPAEIRIAEEFGFSPIALAKNLGIQEGLAHCATVAPTRFVLILENDCALQNIERCRDTLQESLQALKDDQVDVVKLGTTETGNLRKYHRYWRSSAYPRKTWKAIVRPHEARACLGGSVYLSDFPSTGTAYVKPLGNYLYVTDSSHMGWTNRAFMIKREFFLGTIIDFARRHPASGSVNGLPDLEKEINNFWNRSWWRQQKFRVGITRPGLFSHHRLDRH